MKKYIIGFVSFFMLLLITGCTLTESADFYDLYFVPDIQNELESEENKEPISSDTEEIGESYETPVSEGEYEIAVELPAEITEDSETDESQNVTIESFEELPSTEEYTIDVDGVYTTADDVALYIYLYDELPDNFMTKSEARELGWSGGGLDDYAPGMCIGGDYFGNREGLLPKAKGRTYTECDINTLGEDSRGAERIVFSNDGLIYYTDDHYESFVLLYDENGKAS